MMSSVSEFDSTFHFLLSAFSLMSFVFGLTASVNCVDSSSMFQLKYQSTIIVMSSRRV